MNTNLLATFPRPLFNLAMRHLLALLAFCASLALMTSSQAAENMLVFIGTYTGGNSQGIYAYEFSLADGSLKPIGLAAETPSPSFLAIHPNKKFLYAVNEIGNYEGEKSGSVSAFAIEGASGKLRHLNTKSSRGGAPCHIVVDAQGANALVANYSGGSVAVLPIAPDGSLKESSSFVQHTGSSINKGRQSEPHAHSINLDKQNNFAIVADLGLDKLLAYKFDASTGQLSPADPPFASLKPGAGPRHFAFHTGGHHAYVINELDLTITAFDYHPAKGELTPIQTISTLAPKTESKNWSTAEVQVHPSGKFVYGSNRGHDSIAAFKVDPATGKLTYLENEPTLGKTPRNFGIDPTGKFLIAANQGSDTLVVFRIDQQTGGLDPTGIIVEAPKPVCVKFLPL